MKNIIICFAIDLFGLLVISWTKISQNFKNLKENLTIIISEIKIFNSIVNFKIKKKINKFFKKKKRNENNLIQW